jgi:hypothetical protein
MPQFFPSLWKMEKLESELNAIKTKISPIETEIESIEHMLEKDFVDWPEEAKGKYGNEERQAKTKLRIVNGQLWEEKKQLRDKKWHLRDKKLTLLKQQNQLLQRQNEMAARGPTAPDQILKSLLGFDVNTTPVKFYKPSETVSVTTAEEINSAKSSWWYYVRQTPTDRFIKYLDHYFHWNEEPYGEPEKEIKFITVGTAGNGKYKFARRFIDLKYTGKYSHIVNDCKETYRIYTIDCTKFDVLGDVEIQLGLMILNEAFKHSVDASVTVEDFLIGYRLKFGNKIQMSQFLRLIAKSFCSEASPDIDDRLMIINLDQTSSLLTSDKGKAFLEDVFPILQRASETSTVLTVISGSPSGDIYEYQSSCCHFVDVELSLLGLEASEIYGDDSEFNRIH